MDVIIERSSILNNEYLEKGKKKYNFIIELSFLVSFYIK